MADRLGELLGTPRGLPQQRLQDLSPELEVGEGAGRGTPSTISSIPDAQWALRQLTREKPKIEVFRQEARKAFEFYAGDQVSDSDRAAMSGRPIIILNETRKFINIIDGIERRVPLKIYYVARDPSDLRANMKAEIRTKANEWARDATDGDFEIARAKKDRTICGVGWTETYVSRAQNPAGLINIQRFSPLEAIWPATSRENLKGTRWRARKRKMPVDAALQKWPHVADILITAAGGSGGPKNYPIKADLVKYRVPWIMTEPTNKGGDIPPDPEEVSVTDFQYTKGTEGYFFKNPITEQFEWLKTNEFNVFSRILKEDYGLLPKAVEKVIKDTYWRMFFLNDSFVLEAPKPMPIDGFTLNCVTGDWDDKRKIWYGQCRIFFDPQLLIDKLASSAVEILGAQAKTGIDYEQGAATDTQIAEWKRTQSTPGAANQFKRGALTEKRVQYKPRPEVPAGVVALLEFGTKEMTMMSGLSESMLAPGDSTGVGLRQRLSMGLLLLAGYFDASARFERELGDTTQKFLRLVADDRWIRIGGPGNEQAVQLVKGDFDDLLDVTIDDTEQDPTLRRLYMDHIMQLAPTLIRTNNFIPELLDWFLLPVQFREKLKRAIQRNSQQQMQMRMMGIGTGRGKSRTPEEVKAEQLRTTGQAILAFAKAGHLGAQAKDIGRAALTDDLSQIINAMSGIHGMEMAERQHRVDRMRAAGDLYQAFRPENKSGLE